MPPGSQGRQSIRTPSLCRLSAIARSTSCGLTSLFWIFVSLTTAVVSGQTIAPETSWHDQPRPSNNDDALVLDSTKALLTPRETRRLVQRIRSSKDLLDDIDLQLLIVSSVEHGTHGYTPKEFATEVLNNWGLGEAPGRIGGMLVLLVTEENRIEIEFSDSLGHMFNADWVHNLLYSEVIPYFREDRYADGLTQIVGAVHEKLQQYRTLQVRGGGRGERARRGHLQRRRRWEWISGLLGFGGGWYLRGRPRPLEIDKDDNGLPSSPSPPPPSPPKTNARGHRWKQTRPSPPIGQSSGHSQDSIWTNLAYMLGRSSAQGSYGGTKTGNNNINIHYGSPEPVQVNGLPPSFNEAAVRTDTDTVSATGVGSESILRSQTLPPSPPSTSSNEESAQNTTQPSHEASLGKEHVRGSSGGGGISNAGRRSFLSSVRKPTPFGVLEQKSARRLHSPPSKGKIQVVPKKEPSPGSTGLGGGGNWLGKASPSAKPKPSRKQPRPSILSYSSKTSSGHGSGASWSSKTSKPRLPTRPPKKNHESSSNGGGASW